MNHTNVIAKLPMGDANRSIDRANFGASEPIDDRIAGVLACLRECGSVAIFTAACMAMAVAGGMALSSFVPT